MMDLMKTKLNSLQVIIDVFLFWSFYNIKIKVTYERKPSLITSDSI